MFVDSLPDSGSGAHCGSDWPEHEIKCPGWGKLANSCAQLAALESERIDSKSAYFRNDPPTSCRVKTRHPVGMTPTRFSYIGSA
jgi:hypothetical protein